MNGRIAIKAFRIKITLKTIGFFIGVFVCDMIVIFKWLVIKIS